MMELTQYQANEWNSLPISFCLGSDISSEWWFPPYAILSCYHYDMPKGVSIPFKVALNAFSQILVAIVSFISTMNTLESLV